MSERASVVTGADGRTRCAWVGHDEEYLRYHDEEWGVPLRGDRALFEKLALEGFQSGLSWIAILRRRPAFRELFQSFDIDSVAAMSPSDVERLLGDARIIRNRAKIEATIANAAIVRELVADDAGALDRLLWGFAPPPRPAPLSAWADVPATTAESAAASGALKALGFRFVGSTTLYALMQSTGMVDDHLAGCWRVAA